MTDDAFQLTLVPALPPPEPRLPLAVRFELFHLANPRVYYELVMLARRAKRTGAARVGIGQLFEVLRWRHMLRTQGDEFKLNNSFRAFYARMIMANEPDLDGFFETRRSIADEVV